MRWAVVLIAKFSHLARQLLMSSPVVLVLASGKGERFHASGGEGNKLHAMLAGKRLIDWTLDAVKASGLRWHVEDARHEGMGDSIAAAVKETKDASGGRGRPAGRPGGRAGARGAGAGGRGRRGV